MLLLIDEHEGIKEADIIKGLIFKFEITSIHPQLGEAIRCLIQFFLALVDGRHLRLIDTADDAFTATPMSRMLPLIS